MKKVKDLGIGRYLKDVKMKVPNEIESKIREGYWQGAGKNVVWLSEQKHPGTSAPREVIPIFIKDPEEVLEWEIIE